ncbi:hypothetical protein C8F04DRAFT_1335337 [Mycena alexandri]|uniref:Uncharacterized protein n=1 Tax=Mycena alexandri TaxID=1745969 RepID=A0AAD6SZX7_9AGAR|nr:hypothetical protein C8F04DRAFT_1335337 [Mycena alexandri]
MPLPQNAATPSRVQVSLRSARYSAASRARLEARTNRELIAAQHCAWGASRQPTREGATLCYIPTVNANGGFLLWRIPHKSFGTAVNTHTLLVPTNLAPYGPSSAFGIAFHTFNGHYPEPNVETAIWTIDPASGQFSTSASWPSTPTISTPSDLTPSPELPPKLLPAFFTPAKNPPRGAATPNPKPSKANVSDDDMAPPKTLDLFRGNGTAEKAHTWLRSLEQSLKWDAEEKEKLYKFEKGLYPGSQAEAWFGALKPGEKNDWVALLLAFETKWPKPRPTQRAQDVVIAEIANNCLARADLGKYVKDEDGVSVLSHVAWAEVNRRLLGELVTGDAAMMLKSTVRGSLPLEFRHLINDTGLDTWEKYLKAVEDIGVDRITDAVEEYTARHTAIDNSVFAFAAANPNATAEQWEANSNAFALRMMRDLGLSHYAPASASTPGPRSTYIPPAARQSQPAMASTPRPFTPAANPRPYQTPSTAVDPRTPWASRVSPDPFGGSTVRPGAVPFAKSLLTTPGSPSAGRSRIQSLSGDPTRDAQLAHQIAHAARTYPTDPANTQRYHSDTATWMSQNGNSPNPDYATFPFTPGTAAPGSKECFRCGMLTVPPHYGVISCTALNGQELSTKEQNLRAFVGGILHPRGQRTPARIAQVNEVPYNPFGDYDADQHLFDDSESENGEGSAV